MKKEKLIIIVLFALLIQTSISLHANAGLDENKMKSAQIAEGMSVNKPEFDTEKHSKTYKKITKDGVVMQAMELMKTVSIAQYSYNALMGNNLTEKPFKIEFKNLTEINPEYSSFDALGWKKKGRLPDFMQPLMVCISAESGARISPCCHEASRPKRYFAPA